MKKFGFATLFVIAIIAALALATGVLEQVWPAAQPSTIAQRLVSPTEKINTFPITTLANIKDQKQRLEVIDATTKIVRGEFELKIQQSQAAYSTVAAMLSAYGMALYKKQTMYSEDEVKAIKEEKDTTKV